MATWTKIPETKISSTLGIAVGKLVGSISNPVDKSLDKIENRIDNLQKDADILQDEVRVIQDKTEQIILEKESKNEMSSTGGGAYADFLQTSTGASAKGLATKDTVDEIALLQETAARVNRKISSFNSKSRSEISTMRVTLNAATRSVNSILSILATLKAVVTSLKIPIPPFEVIIKIIKLLPIPQRYLIVSFTILESDLLEMLEQLIAQAKEEILGIESLIESMESILQPILDRIERIKARLNLLQLDCVTVGASAQDRRILDMYGYVDSKSGDNLFRKIQKGLAGQGSDLGGGFSSLPYGLSGLDLSKSTLSNQLRLAKAGDIVGLDRKPTGSFIQTWFCDSDTQPEIPAGFPRVSGSWTLKPEATRLPLSTSSSLEESGSAGVVRNYWKVDLKVTGDGNIFGGLNDTPVQATEEDLSTNQNFDLGSDQFRVLDKSNFKDKPGILKVDDWSDFMDSALSQLKDLPLTQEFKDDLNNLWNEMVTSAKGNTNEKETPITKYQWRSKTGEIYNLEILEDEHSPKVAVRRFVRVTDQAGTVILDGIKTFSIDIESLLQEIKLQLDQLTR